MPASIQIKLFATMASKLPADADQYPIRGQTAVKDLLSELGIPAHQAKLIFINGRKAGPDTLLQDGDRLGVFPPVGGG
jgi:molybdopterin converting factor small subunit